MGKSKLNKTYIFKMQFFWSSYCYKNSVFRVLVTIEPCRSLLQFVTMNCLIKEEGLTDKYRIFERTNEKEIKWETRSDHLLKEFCLEKSLVTSVTCPVLYFNCLTNGVVVDLDITGLLTHTTTKSIFHTALRTCPK